MKKNDKEIEMMEKRLQGLRPVAPSENFFERLEQSLAENESSSGDIEARLRKMKPIAPSENFFTKISEKMDSPDNTEEFPHHRTVQFPKWMYAASAAAAVVAVGMTAWISNNAVETAQSERRNAVATSFSLQSDKVAAVDNLKSSEKPEYIADAHVSGLDDGPIVVSKVIDLSAVRNTRPPNGYRLTSTERNLNRIQQLPIVAMDDGSLVRPVRYIYTTASRWENQKENKTYVEYHPYEEVVPTLVQVN